MCVSISQKPHNASLVLLGFERYLLYTSRNCHRWKIVIPKRICQPTCVCGRHSSAINHRICIHHELTTLPGSVFHQRIWMWHSLSTWNPLEGVFLKCFITPSFIVVLGPAPCNWAGKAARIRWPQQDGCQDMLIYLGYKALWVGCLIMKAKC